MSPVHGYGHRNGAVHGGDHLVVGRLQQADVVHTIHIAELKDSSGVCIQ